MRKVIDGAIGDELLAKITSNPQTRVIALGRMDAGSRNFYNSKHAVRSAADLKGLKVRVMGNHLAVLRRDVRRADAGDLCAGDLDGDPQRVPLTNALHESSIAACGR
jgi:TRAP-type mannitol/chloroaromatic compound transport system substrate-binding protein